MSWSVMSCFSFPSWCLRASFTADIEINALSVTKLGLFHRRFTKSSSASQAYGSIEIDQSDIGQLEWLVQLTQRLLRIHFTAVRN